MSRYVKGSWNAICDRCGFEYKSHQLRHEWTGLMVCYGGGTTGCYEERHPQDFVRGRRDKQSVPWSRPEGEDVFLDPNDVTEDDLG